MVQKSKKKTHQNLAANILKLNQQVHPDLHIVDALVAMMGLGPSRGKPVCMNTIVIGTDPLMIDLVCAKLATFDYRQVRTLNLARQIGLLSSAHCDFLNNLDVKAIQHKFAPPKAGFLASFFHSPKRQKYFLKLRSMKLFSYLAETDWFGKLLLLSGLRQDIFLEDEIHCEALSFETGDCEGCSICRDVCPLGWNLPDELNTNEESCLQCLYCYSVCPERRIKFKGNLGFYKEQLRQYDTVIRNLYQQD